MNEVNLKINFCQKCKRAKELYTGKLCDKCLIEVLTKRIKKNIKEQGGLKREQKVLFLKENNVESKIAELFLQYLYQDLKLKIDYEKKETKYDKTIIPCSAEDEITVFLEKIFNNNLKKYLKTKQGEDFKKIIFLESLTSEEIKDIAKIKKIEGEVKKHELLDKIEKKYPGSKHSLVKSMKVLED